MRILISFFPNCHKMVRLAHKRNKGEHIFIQFGKLAELGGGGVHFPGFASHSTKWLSPAISQRGETASSLWVNDNLNWSFTSKESIFFQSVGTSWTEYTAKIFALRRSHLLRQSIDPKMHQRDDAFPYHTFEKTRKSQPHLCFLLRLCKRRFQKQWQRRLIWFFVNLL